MEKMLCSTIHCLYKILVRNIVNNFIYRQYFNNKLNICTSIYFSQTFTPFEYVSVKFDKVRCVDLRVLQYLARTIITTEIY